MEGTQNGNANLDSQEKTNERESEKMEVNSIVSSEGTDAVQLEEENSMKLQEIMDEPETMSVAAEDLGLPTDFGASPGNMETFSDKKDTLDSMDATSCSDSSNNHCYIAESAHESPVKPTVILSEVSHSTPSCQTNDKLDETSLEIPISDPQDDAIIISEDDDIIIVPLTETSDEAKFPGLHRGAVVPYSDSEDSDSSSSSSSSSSDSSDESDESDSEKTNG